MSAGGGGRAWTCGVSHISILNGLINNDGIPPTPGRGRGGFTSHQL